MFRPVSPAPKAKGQKVQVPVQPEWETDADRYTHTTVPTAGGFFFLIFDAVICLATALINSSTLVLQELNVPGKKNYFRQADRKIMQSRVEKKQVFSSECCERHSPPEKQGPCFIHAL